MESGDCAAAHDLFQRCYCLERLLFLSLVTLGRFAGDGTPGSGGVDIGDIPVKLAVTPLQGMRRDPATGALTKVWGRSEAEVPLHMALWQSTSADPRFMERPGTSPTERLPPGTSVVITSPALAQHCDPPLCSEHRGCVGVITDPADHNGGVSLSLETWPAEPPFGRAIASAVGDKYVAAAQAAAALRLRPDLFGKICGSLIVDPGKYDLGLRFKIQHGQFCLLGCVSVSPLRAFFAVVPSAGCINAFSYCRTAERESDSNSSGPAWSEGDAVRIVGSQSAAEAQVGKSSCVVFYCSDELVLRAGSLSSRDGERGTMGIFAACGARCCRGEPRPRTQMPASLCSE